MPSLSLYASLATLFTGSKLVIDRLVARTDLVEISRLEGL